jgi:hypothetical protein
MDFMGFHAHFGMGFQWFLDGILMDFDDLSFKNM